MRWPSEPGGAEQHPLHFVHIRAREFDPRGQAVWVQEKRLRLAAAALRPAARVLRPVAGTLGGAQGIGDHLPQEGSDEKHVGIQAALPGIARVLTRGLLYGTVIACHGSLLVPLTLHL